MKLKLRNFRCHTTTQFELPDSGMVLLSGTSGSGKSTILKAIMYALYGSKAVRKPYTFGVTTCSVTLEFMGMKVHRTNRPNRLVVNDQLEDAAAQAYIDEKMGACYEEFLVSSYIPQKNNSSILSLSQLEQLKMIKTLAFEGEQNENHKERIKELIGESSDELVKTRTETQFTQREVDRINEGLCPIEFPLILGVGETEDDTVAQYRERMRNFNNRMTEFLERRSVCNEELQNHVYAKAELEMTNERLDGINTKLSKVNGRQQQLQVCLRDVPSDLQEQIEGITLQIHFLELQKQHCKLQEQYESVQTEEQHERQTQQTQLERALWKHRGRTKTLNDAENERDSYSQQVQLWEQYLDALKKLEKLGKELQLEATTKDAMVEHYNELVSHVEEEKIRLYKEKEQLAVAAEQLALEKEIINCPECEAPLRWQDRCLVSVHDHKPVEERDYEAEIEAVEERIAELDETKAEHNSVLQRLHNITVPAVKKTDPEVYEQMKQQIKVLTNYISQNQRREEELERIVKESEPGYLTPALRGLKKDLDRASKELQIAEEELTEEPNEDVDTLSDLLRDLTAKLDSHAEHTEELEIVESELKDLRAKSANMTKQLAALRAQVAGVNTDAIKKRLTVIDRDIAKAKKKQAEDEELSDKVDQYLIYRDQRKDLDRWEEKLAVAVKELKEAEKVHAGRLALKEKYIQAEIMALESTISSINEHTRYYLDTFFADHQLSAVLEAAYKGKKIQTLKINTAINYKGNEYDSIGQLSGGEFDRCTLASICGISSMLGSPLLMLDESLSSLDADTNTEIIRFLSELSQDKLIIVCSHEAVRGIFDEIIEM